MSAKPSSKPGVFLVPQSEYKFVRRADRFREAKDGWVPAKQRTLYRDRVKFARWAARRDGQVDGRLLRKIYPNSSHTFLLERPLPPLTFSLTESIESGFYDTVETSK